MAGLMDQYEEELSKGSMATQRKKPPQLSACGYVTATLEDEVPIFVKQRINFKPKDSITHLVAGKNVLVLALKNNMLLRIDLQNADKPDEIEVPKVADGDRLYGLYLDPTGQHLLLSTVMAENYYLAYNTKKPKSLVKLKGYQISAVAWNKERVSVESTGEILLGTSRGHILEMEIQNQEDGRFFQALVEKYVTKHTGLCPNNSSAVTGLEFERMHTDSYREHKYFIMATLPGRLFEFLGTVPAGEEGPIFQYVFENYPDVQERFLELPGSLGYSRLQFYASQFRKPPNMFAWMTEPGVYMGKISVMGEAGVDSVVLTPHLVPYPAWTGDVMQGRQRAPLALVLTEFHILLVFSQWLKVICILNEKLVHQEYISEEKYGRLVGLSKDLAQGTIWMYTTDAVLKVKVTRESRDIWNIYLDQGNYEMAKTFCQNNPAQLDQVLAREAEDLFEKRQYVQSARVLAWTQSSFEQACLRFIHKEDALQMYLQEKLNSLQPQDKTQLSLLSTWLIELLLSQLGELRERRSDVSQAEAQQLQDQLRTLFKEPKLKGSLNENRQLVYDLIDTHGDVDNMIFFAYLMNDYERVLTYHLQNDSYLDALKVLQKQGQPDLFYKFSPVLMQNIPQETVKAWIEARGRLEPRKLIPALVQYDSSSSPSASNEAIRYLEFCLTEMKIDDEAIHNYLLSLYAKVQPQKLMQYLHHEGEEPEDVNYDLKYALRVCSDHQRREACVFIYSIMALFEEAVDLAIQFDIDLAKENASKPTDAEVQKKLWLKIAKHVVKKDGNIKKAMQFLQDCDDTLKIEDILPFFDDFVTIDHFKDAICESLEKYTEHINSLKEEMDQATEGAQEIRTEIRGFKNNFMVVGVQEKCSVCLFPLMTRTFYVFPCLHKFHSDCLASEVLPHCPRSTRLRAEELQRELASQGSSPPTPQPRLQLHDSNPFTVARQLSLHNVKEELDEIIAGECIYCGDLIIRCVDKPFLDNANLASPVQDWW